MELGLKDEIDVLKVSVVSRVLDALADGLTRFPGIKQPALLLFRFLLCQFENGTQGLSAQ